MLFSHVKRVPKINSLKLYSDCLISVQGFSFLLKYIAYFCMYFFLNNPKFTGNIYWKNPHEKIREKNVRKIIFSLSHILSDHSSRKNLTQKLTSLNFTKFHEILSHNLSKISSHLKIRSYSMDNFVYSYYFLCNCSKDLTQLTQMFYF